MYAAYHFQQRKQANCYLFCYYFEQSEASGTKRNQIETHDLAFILNDFFTK